MAINTLPSRSSDSLPLPPKLPLRSGLDFARDPLAFFVQSYQRLGPAFRLQAFDFNLTVMLGAPAHQAVFAEHADKLFARKGYSLLLPLIDDALLVSDGEVHARQKRLVQPAFHVKRIETYLDIMRDVAERKTSSWRDGGVIDIYAEARMMTLESIVRALTGDDFGDDFNTLAETITQTFEYVTKPNIQKWVKVNLPITGYGQSLRARAKLDALLYGMIRARRASAQSSDDMLSWLIEARDADGTQLTDKQVRDQVLLLIYAGHDTATCSLAWALHLLAAHPGAAQSVVEEVRRVGPLAAMKMADLRAMPQLDMVLDETLRLYPPVWLSLRGVTETFTFEGMRIPAGSNVMYSAGASHRLPEVFPDPLRFDPQRMTPERKARLPQFSYVPYGGGAHMCIGMPFAQAELKVLLAHILTRWRVEPANDKPIAMRYNPTLAPKHGIPLRVKRV